MSEKVKNPKVSVVIPVYNVEKYLGGVFGFDFGAGLSGF